MRRWLLVAVTTTALSLALVLPAAAVADDWAPRHHCIKPVKPYQFTSEFQVRSYKDDVEEYERCIDDFVRAQKAAVEAHREAAKQAVDEWNLFVQLELR
jgi:hypothetical protein